MARVITSDRFERTYAKLDKCIQIQLNKLLDKIIKDPKVGKPMRYDRKGTREVYSGSFRLSYLFDNEAGTLYILDFYHKDKQ